MLEYNCPATRIGEASAITPGFSSPTVQHTGDEAWLAVKVMVEKSGVQAVMDRLEALGCRAIIETEVVHCRL
jgi:ATP phosphoribosyltransferase